jgi:DNA-binding transcriptional regulator LsrR (DeoR family)
MERIEMSQQERDKLEWLKRAKDGVITQREAARKMGVTDRWVRKLLKRMNKRGDAVQLPEATSRELGLLHTEAGGENVSVISSGAGA